MVDRPTVLLPVRILEGESIPDGIPELLHRSHVVLLGYHVIPEQTATEQAELQFEERALKRLDELTELLEDAGATVDQRLVFTHRAQQTLDRITREQDCDAVIVPNATATVDEVLVPIAGVVGVDRIAAVVAGLFGPETEITLFHIPRGDETEEDARTFLEGVADRLVDLGVDGDRIAQRIETADDPLDAIIAASAEYDAVVMGESDPSIATFVFGMPADQVAESFLGPVVVVQRSAPEPAEE